MGFALHGTKFFLIMFNQMKPNQLGFIEAALFSVEAGWTIYIIILFADKGSECNDNEPLIYWCLLLSVINGLFKIVQAVIYVVTAVISMTLFCTKMLTYKQVGESINFLGTFIGAHHHEEEEEEEKEKLNPDEGNQRKEEERKLD